ncbi:MAG TPA: hypothetical protein VJN18_35685 [Polyangiaceae bacterium]|nr:hypothetical protein [Polyangiaceae bacterium]
MSAPLPPLVVLLLHLGACSEAVAWAGKRNISAESLAACPRAGWREWLAAALKVDISEPAQGWIRAAETALSGSGSGSGSGYGSGYGDGDGYGSGYGYGYGSGYGYGYGSGYGDGYGSGYGDGDGYGSGYATPLAAAGAT